MGKPYQSFRLVPRLVDEIAESQPSRIWASVPVDVEDLSRGWQDYTYAHFANAVNRVAQRFLTKVGPGIDFPTVAYIGPNDLRYLIFVLASLKAGYKALLISPRNSIEGQLNLFRKTDCNIIAYTDNLHATVNPWLAEREMRAFVVGTQEDWLAEAQVPHVPYTASFEQAEYGPFVVLHTSGSTGLPKPIVVRHGMMAVADGLRDLGLYKGHEYWLHSLAKAERLLMTSGLYMSMMIGIYFGVIISLPPAGKPVSLELIVNAIKYSKADASIVAPSIIEEMAFDDEAAKAVAALKFIAFGGGAAAKDAGDRLVAQGANLYNLIASTECMPLPLYMPTKPQEWHTFIFDEECGSLEWKAVEGQDDVYEQVMIKTDPRSGQEGCFYTFPDLDEWSTRDLFKKVPGKPSTWTYFGRADNILVFSNGEKLNPVTIEDSVTGHPKIAGALVVGSGKFQPSLLLEPHEPPQTYAAASAFIDEIWPTIMRANKATVAHGQIGRQFIALTNPKKPFPRAGKGSIQRGLAAQLYKDEIERIYEKAGQGPSAAAIKLDASSEETLTESIREAFSSSLGIKSLGADSDFFNAGIDSMQVLTMSRTLQSSLKAANISADASAIASRVIYTNPTPRRLAASLFRQISSSGAVPASTWDIHDMEAMITKYTHDLPLVTKSAREPVARDLTVVLTGSTGAIGSYLLDFLNANPAVKSVIALNRAKDGHARQKTSSESRGLDTSFTKTKFLHSDLSDHNLGLSQEAYNELQQNTDMIIHNQWQVDFNLSLPSFEPHVRGVRNLIDLSATSHKRPHITFISSVAVVSAFPAGKPVPEETLKDLTYAVGGYGQSKLVGSFILEAAQSKSNVSSAIIRVGQVAGPLAEKGAWNRHEWFPSIIASSGYLGLLPSDLGPMETATWVPIETEARLILDVAFSRATGFFHGVNPRSTTWGALKSAVKSYYGDRIKGEVPWQEWVAALKKSQEQIRDEDVARNPGVKLLDFYEGTLKAGEGASSGEAVKMETSRTEGVSDALRNLSAVKPEWLAHWCAQWGF